MKLTDILDIEVTEGVTRQYKKVGGKPKKKFRCGSGRKKGKIVSKPSDCFKRKDPKKVRRGKKIMRIKKKIIARKSRISKRRSISKLISRMNKKLAGKK